ncbi:class I lanthipeptide [Pontimicrobium sp. MEBiC01747]
MKTQAQNKLQFNKQNIIELNDVNMANIKGGTQTISTLQCLTPDVATSLGSIIPPRDTSWFCNMVNLENEFGQ